MSLLDDLKHLLIEHHLHISTQVNQGTAHLVEDHLSRIEAAVENDVAAAEATVHSVLGELYAALNAFVPKDEPAPADPAPAPESTPPVEPAPAEPVAEPAAADEAPVAEAP